MGTICLGLLIAIGLEQSVEWMHRRSERQEIREGVHADLEKTLRTTEATYADLQPLIAYEEQLLRTGQDALTQKKPFSPAGFGTAGRGIEIGSDPAFRAARASGELHLLSQEEVKTLSEVDGELDLTEATFTRFLEAGSQINGFNVRFGRPGQPGNGWAQADATDIREFLNAVSLRDGALKHLALLCSEDHEAAGAALGQKPEPLLRSR